ncbi:hypothetical protein PAPYR_7313 [Paratrimastix pyriformis]|uniref:Uncharacterized protein n=1 Tax=Paratrimastix pyriformis TaxID=342808 RepID=A0ABQ8UDB6_9EUKA|nr:hypothetical protein PAPYR_7313 [Paratrimastix pyriformis]
MADPFSSSLEGDFASPRLAVPIQEEDPRIVVQTLLAQIDDLPSFTPTQLSGLIHATKGLCIKLGKLRDQLAVLRGEGLGKLSDLALQKALQISQQGTQMLVQEVERRPYCCCCIKRPRTIAVRPCQHLCVCSQCDPTDQQQWASVPPSFGLGQLVPPRAGRPGARFPPRGFNPAPGEASCALRAREPVPTRPAGPGGLSRQCGGANGLASVHPAAPGAAGAARDVVPSGCPLHHTPAIARGARDGRASRPRPEP